jgi:hypothetical protein
MFPNFGIGISGEGLDSSRICRLSGIKGKTKKKNRNPTNKRKKKKQKEKNAG